MKSVNDRLYIEFLECVEWLGLSERYLQKAVSGGLKCWQAIPDPEDNRKVLIEFGEMQRKHKEAIRRKSGGDPWQYQKDQEALAKLEAQSEEQRLLPEIVESVVDNADFEHFRTKLNRTDALEHARACAWLRLLAGVMGKTDAKKYGFESKAALYEAALECLEAAKLKPLRVSNKRVLQERLKDWKAKGLESVVHGNLGKPNAAKLTEEGKRFLVALMADPHKPPFPIVARLYNRKAREEGWKAVTAMTCANYLTLPDVKIKWMLGRHGEDAWYQQFDVTIRRSNASAPDVLWIVDGTPLDLYYKATGTKWNEKTGKHETKTGFYNRAYAFFCLDAYSWKLTGILSKSEDMKAVRDCLKKATEAGMTLPRQLQSDRGAAILAQSFLVEQMKVHNTPTRPYSPKAKVIEPVLGHFQNEVLRYFDNFAGLNITAKRMDSRYNPDFVHEHRHDVPEWDGLQRQFDEALDIWNNYETEGRKAPNKLIAHKSQGHPVGRLAFLDMFWEKRKGTYLYHSDGIHLSYDGEEHIYTVPDADFYKRYVKDRFEVAFDRDTPDYIYLYKDGKPVIWNGEPAMAMAVDLVPMALHDMQPGDRERLNRLLALKDKVKKDTQLELAEIQGEFDISMGARYVHKEALNDAETTVKRDWASLSENEYL